MRELLNTNDTNVIKQGDSSEEIRLSARNDNSPVTWSSDDTGEIHVDTADGAFTKKFPATLITNSNNVLVDSQNLADLKAGKYTLELWVTLDGGKNAIYPSDGALALTIDRNADDIESSGRVTTITLDDFKQQVMKSVQDQINNANLTDKTGQKVDLSDYAKKTDVPNIVYDASAHTLTINGQSVDLPANVDLSGYAKKSDVPNIVYDSQSRTLTVNGTQVDLPANVDLSSYATKQDVASYVESHTPTAPTVDLTPYVKKSDLEDYAKVAQLSAYATTSDLSNYATVADLAGYAKSNQVPAVAINPTTREITINGQSLTIPESVDLSGYAKTGDVPSVKLDGRKLTINGVSVDIPDDVDLSGYYTKAEVDQKVADAAAGGKIDLSGYVTVADADKKYATKSELPDVSNFVTSEAVAETYATKAEIPSAPDLTSYETKSEANETFATKAEIPSVPDVSSFITSQDIATTYATKSEIPTMPDLTPYETKSEASATYATKAEIPSVPDVSSFITSQAVSSEYATKSEIPTMPDLNDYVKTEALSSYATKSEIPAIPDMASYATTSYVTSEVANIKPASVDLSSYETVSHAESTYVRIGAVDEVLGQYAKVSSVYDKDYINSNYLTNSDTRNVINNLVSLKTGEIKQELNNVEARALTPYNFQQDVEMFNLLDSYATQKYVDDKVSSIKSSSSSSSSSRELYGDIIPAGSKDIHIQLQFGMIRYTYTPKDGSAPKSDVIGDSGTISFAMLRQAMQTDSIKYDISFGFNNATKFTIPENTIQGTTTLDMSQVHVMSIDYDKDNWIIIHALLPNEEIQDQPLFTGGQVADIILTGPDRQQTAHMGTIAIKTYPTITAQ